MFEDLKKYFDREKILIIIVSAAIGVFLFQLKQPAEVAASPRSFRDNTEKYAFINPLLFYNFPSEPKAFPNILPKVQKTIDDFKASDKDSNASIYLKDLETGAWVGINTSEKYNPASLLKVAVMIAYYKEAETNPAILNKYLLYTSEIQNSYANLPYDQPTDLVLGKYYLAQDLINKMIMHSDNGATYTLLANIDNSKLDNVYYALSIENPTDAGRDYTIAPGQYSYLFRILYNATYLDHNMSEKALSLLSQTDYKDGLVAGVAGSISISHKWGEFVATNSDSSIRYVELHDCGIIYYPNNDTYLLCIMTRGSTIDQLKSLIKNISAEVYNNWPKR